MRSSRSVLNHVRVQSLAPRRFSTMPAFRQIERGQVEEDKSQATGLSKVPKSVQDAVPKGVEESPPDSVCPSQPCQRNETNKPQIHPTGSSPGQSTNKTHAKMMERSAHGTALLLCLCTGNVFPLILEQKVALSAGILPLDLDTHV
ncbi:hypothetical protein LZL87_006260 [Fusarium oxysporum]|nr:hypothetical protein LZL87_006260 [Fusarium oxysporum]